MESTKRAGMAAGLLFLAQGLLAPLLNFRLLRPGTSTDFLVTAAANSAAVRVGLLLMLTNALFPP